MQLVRDLCALAAVHTSLSSPDIRLAKAFFAETCERIACLTTSEGKKKDVCPCALTHPRGPA